MGLFSEFEFDFFSTDSIRAWDRELFPQIHQERTDDGYEITVEVPGCKQKDVSVEILGTGFLYLKGSRKGRKFEHTFSLPSYLDKDGAKATVEDGLLTITIPMKSKGRKLL